MNRKQLQRLIAASLFSGALLSGIVWADDMPMDTPMSGNTMEKTRPTEPSTNGKTTKKMNGTDASPETMPAKHRKHGQKKMKDGMDKDMGMKDKGMGMSDKMGGMKDMPANASK